MNLVQGHLTSVASFHLLVLGMLGSLVLCSIPGATMLLKLPRNRNQGRCFYTLQLWFLQWLEVVMLLFRCTEGSARLPGMEALFSAVRCDWVYFNFFSPPFALIFYHLFPSFISLFSSLLQQDLAICRVLKKRYLGMLKMELSPQGVIAHSFLVSNMNDHWLLYSQLTRS